MALPGGGRGDTTGCNESATVAAIANPGDGMSPSLTEGALWERTGSDRGSTQLKVFLSLGCLLLPRAPSPSVRGCPHFIGHRRPSASPTAAS